MWFRGPIHMEYRVIQVDLIYFQWWLNQFKSSHFCCGKRVLVWAGKGVFHCSVVLDCGILSLLAAVTSLC